MKDTAAELVFLPGTYDPATHAVAGPLTVVPAGDNIFSGHPAKSVELDSLLPWDHQFHTELGLASAKHSRKDADRLAQKFYVKYEKLIKTPTPGFKYDQVYDLKTRKIINTDLENNYQNIGITH